MYSEKIYELFDSMKNAGRIKGADISSSFEDVKTHDVVKVFLKIENEAIVDAKFKCDGSIATMVIADNAMELIKNHTLSEVKSFSQDKIAQDFAQVRSFDTYGAGVVLNAIKQAVEDYEEKQRKLLIKQLKEEGKPIPEELKK